MRTWALAGLLGCLLPNVPALGADASREKGTVQFRLKGDQAKVPERYRLDEHQFDYTLAPHRELRNIGVTVYRLQFPSPVTTPTPENNCTPSSETRRH